MDLLQNHLNHYYYWLMIYILSGLAIIASDEHFKMSLNIYYSRLTYFILSIFKFLLVIKSRHLSKDLSKKSIQL